MERDRPNRPGPLATLPGVCMHKIDYQRGGGGKGFGIFKVKGGGRTFIPQTKDERYTVNSLRQIHNWSHGSFFTLGIVHLWATDEQVKKIHHDRLIATNDSLPKELQDPSHQ